MPIRNKHHFIYKKSIKLNYIYAYRLYKNGCLPLITAKSL